MGVPDIFLVEAVIRRGEIYDMRRRQMLTLDSIFTMLFAYNRMWQPDSKWYNEQSTLMDHKPDDLVRRVDLLLSERDPFKLMTVMRRLMVDTLQVLSGNFDVDDLITGLEAIDIKK